MTREEQIKEIGDIIAKVIKRDCVSIFDEDDDGEVGRARMPSVREIRSVYPKFQRFYRPDEMDQLRVVEYCYYNSCEPGDYYDPSNDKFYDEVLLD